MTVTEVSPQTSVTLNGSGVGQCSIGPPSGTKWALRLATVAVSSSANQPQCLLYRGNPQGPIELIDTTYTGANGSSGKVAGVLFYPGQMLWAVWTGGDAGATATLRAFGVQGSRTDPLGPESPGQGFDNPIVAGTTLIIPSIHSPNYVAGVSGWTINKDGSAEFNSIVVRGTIDVTDPSNGVELLIGPFSPVILAKAPVGTEAWIHTKHTTDINSNYRFESTIDGDLHWGAGGSLVDTSLRRTGTGQLTVDHGGSGTGGTLVADDLTANTLLTALGALITNNRIQYAEDTAVTGSTTSALYTDTLTGASGVLAITFTAPPSGIIAVHYGSQGSNTGGYIGTAVEVWTGNTVGGGSSVYAGRDQDASFQSGNPAAQAVGKVTTISGLTAGSPYYVKMVHRVNAGTGNAIRRSLTLIPSL